MYFDEGFYLPNIENKTENYNWVWVLIVFFIIAFIVIRWMYNRVDRAVYPSDVKLIERKYKVENNPMQTIINIKDDNKKKKKQSKRKLSIQVYKLKMKKKYPNESFEMACQFEKNKKVLQKLQDKIKHSKLMKKVHVDIKKPKIPTEICDLETILKTDKVKPNIKTIVNMKFKRDKILDKMRKDKIVKRRREYFK